MENWKPMYRWEDKYRISDSGEIMSVFTGKIIKQQITMYNYKRVSLYRVSTRKNEHLLVSRLVLASFVRPSIGKEHCNHKDGNRQNNSLENLEWCTPSENIQHAYTNLGKITWNKGKRFPELHVPSGFLKWKKENDDQYNKKQDELHSRKNKIRYKRKYSRIIVARQTRIALDHLKSLLPPKPQAE